MKIIAIGIGQCGCNIADEFYAINNYAKSFLKGRIEILIDAFALNTDETDLTGLRHIPKDKHHRIVIGAMRTFGHGVGKINVDAAKIMKQIEPAIADYIYSSKRFHESDAIMVIASGGGGTGSGAIGWLIKGLKERIDKQVYAIVVLPFGYEERGDTSFATVNTATCLKMVNKYADATFLFDNNRFARADVGLTENLRKMNRAMVMNFYDLFCAGEEKRQKYVGNKVVDAGDIKQSLQGISVIGKGLVDVSTFLRFKKNDYRETVKETVGVAGAMNQAVNNLCSTVNMEDARNILVLICAPKDIINLTVLDEISTFLQEKSPESVVRIGDYPRGRRDISLTLILSKLTSLDRMEKIFLRAEHTSSRKKEIDKDAIRKIVEMNELSETIPDLEHVV